jgi:hypothetical protein
MATATTTDTNEIINNVFCVTLAEEERDVELVFG